MHHPSKIIQVRVERRGRIWISHSLPRFDLQTLLVATGEQKSPEMLLGTLLLGSKRLTPSEPLPFAVQELAETHVSCLNNDAGACHQKFL